MDAFPTSLPFLASSLHLPSLPFGVLFSFLFCFVLFLVLVLFCFSFLFCFVLVLVFVFILVSSCCCSCFVLFLFLFLFFVLFLFFHVFFAVVLPFPFLPSSLSLPLFSLPPFCYLSSLPLASMGISPISFRGISDGRQGLWGYCRKP